MVELYYDDLIGKNKEGSWGVEPNKLIRFSSDGKEEYHYTFKRYTSDLSLLGLLRSIVNPLNLTLVDNGHIFPLSIFDKYKLYGKVTTEYYHIKRQLELTRNMEAIKQFTRSKKEPKKKSYSQTINNHGTVNEQINVTSNNSSATGDYSFAFGRNNVGSRYNMSNNTKRDRILELIRKNEERVKYGR